MVAQVGFSGKTPKHTAASKSFTSILKIETSYQYELKQDRLFGGSLLDKVNWRFNRFLDSCAHGEVDKIDTKKLDFDNIMEQVERREYNTKVPIWIKKLIRKQEASKKTMHDRDHENGNGEGGSGGNGRQKRRQFTDDQARSRRIMNPSMREDCKLRQNEQFKDVFHPGNNRTLTKPKYKMALRCVLYTMLLAFALDIVSMKKAMVTWTMRKAWNVASL